jgi:HlyD family secretion protein
VKRKWKITLGVVLLLLVTGGIVASVKMNQRGVVTVQTGKVGRQDLASLVTASGEVKPRNYINIGANSQGAARIMELLVKEGDRVRKGQVVARLESNQAEAEVASQRAAITASQADSAAAEASVRVSQENTQAAQATLERTKAELTRTQLNYNRALELFNAKLIAKQEFDQRKAEFDAQSAAVREAEVRVQQARAQAQQTAAQLSSSQRRIAQLQASLRRASDVLDKYNATAPLEGIVTNLPVRIGETVIPGMPNLPGSTLMTIADMSLITAEVKVDETDIVNVKLDQVADITIDAIPNRTFKGHVLEIGNTAILRSSGVAASQSAVSSQEAKDFKVIIALDNPPDDIRPGLSCTAKITTATRSRVLTIPIQALTVRTRGDLEPAPAGKGGSGVQAAAKPDPAKEKVRKEELQGVFVINGEKAVFRQIDTGITGATDIEIVKGLQEGDEVITGSYKVIRTLKNDARVKVDNRNPAKDTPAT